MRSSLPISAAPFTTSADLSGLISSNLDLCYITFMSFEMVYIFLFPSSFPPQYIRFCKYLHLPFIDLRYMHVASTILSLYLMRESWIYVLRIIM